MWKLFIGFIPVEVRESTAPSKVLLFSLSYHLSKSVSETLYSQMELPVQQPDDERINL